MELNEAFLQISAIRRQMAQSEQFRGYRAVPVAISALLAFVAGPLQAMLITDPSKQWNQYLALWMAVAVISGTICLGNVWLRYYRSGTPMHQETTLLALGQFFPCLIAGGLLTLVVAKTAPHVAWMLPGLWAILYSMGLFASWRLLPRPMFGVAAYYLGGGLAAVQLGSGQYALSPWVMPLLFGVGQLATAVILLLSERERGRTS